MSHSKVCFTFKDTERADGDILEIVEVGRSVQIIGEKFASTRNAM